MNFKSKISSVVKSNLSNLVGGFSSSISGFIDSGKNSAQTNLAAAKLLNKSPLEISDDTPTAVIKQNPYEYGTVYYPNDVSNLGAGHYMIFDIIMLKHSQFKSGTFQNGNYVKKPNLTTDLTGDIVGEKSNISAAKSFKDRGILDRLTKVNTGINKRNNTHNHVTDSIILYTPPQVKTTYAANYDQVETGKAGFAVQQGFSGMLDTIGSISGDLLKDALNTALTLIPGVGDLNAVIDKSLGRARNPNLEMVFKSVPMREFNFTFEFAPKNRTEMESVDKIIKLFKFHMQPETLAGSDYFRVPSEFQLTYMYMDKQNGYIPKISRCVLKSMEVDQSPEGVFTTFSGDDRGAFPTLTKMTMTFVETEVMTKQKITEGF